MTSGSGTPRGLSPWVRGLQCPLWAIQHGQTSGKTCMLNVFWKQILKHTLSSWSKGLSKESVQVQSLKLFAGTISKGTSISIHANTVAKMIMFVKETNMSLCLMAWRDTWNHISSTNSDKTHCWGKTVLPTTTWWYQWKQLRGDYKLHKMPEAGKWSSVVHNPTPMMCSGMCSRGCMVKCKLRVIYIYCHAMKYSYWNTTILFSVWKLFWYLWSSRFVVDTCFGALNLFYI